MRHHSGTLGIQVELQGGLGNQLFGWACAYAVSKKLALGLSLDTSRLTQHGFQLGNMNHGGSVRSPQKTGKNRFIKGGLHKTFQEKSFMYDNSIKSINSSVYLRGYFQSWKYFTDFSEEIKERVNQTEIVSPKAREILSKFNSMNLNVVHIRRGDYANLQNYHGLTSSAYYERARRLLNKLGENNEFIVFSDDIQAAIQIWPNAEMYVSQNDVPSPFENLLLMSRGKNFIGSNSSFSWWASYLNTKQGIKVFPRPWFTSQLNDTRDLLLPGWLTLGNEPGD